MKGGARIGNTQGCEGIPAVVCFEELLFDLDRFVGVLDRSFVLEAKV